MAGRRGALRLIGIACALVLLAGCVAGVTPQQTPVSSPAPGSLGTAATTLEVGGRPVLLYVPASRPADSTTALVVVLHGYTGDAAGVVEFFGLRPLADQHGFVIAAPQGTTDGAGDTFWNASRSCCNFQGSTVDDSGFLSRVIATVVATSEHRPGTGVRRRTLQRGVHGPQVGL